MVFGETGSSNYYSENKEVTVGLTFLPHNSILVFEYIFFLSYMYKGNLNRCFHMNCNKKYATSLKFLNNYTYLEV